MNTTNMLFDNGQMNWDAISTISNSVLVLALVIITWWYARQVARQTKFMEIDRLYEEMDKLVAPLNSEIDSKIIFQKGSSGNVDSVRPRDQSYLIFWNDVKRNKYLAPNYLHSAIDNYLKNKSTTVNDKTRDSDYEKAESELFDAIKKRYSELKTELSKF